MTTTEHPDTRTAAELENAIVDGDLAITADQLRAARDRELVAGLHQSAAERQAAADDAARRAAEIEQLHTDTAALAGRDVDGPLRAMEDQLRALGVEYADAVAEHNREVAALGARARALGLTELMFTTGNTPVAYGWHAMGGDVMFRSSDGGRGTVRGRGTAAGTQALALGIDDAQRADAETRRPKVDPEEAAGRRTYVLTAGGVPLGFDRITEAWRRQIDRNQITVITRERYEALVAEQATR